MRNSPKKNPFDPSSLPPTAQLFLRNVFDKLMQFQTDPEKMIEIIEQNKNNLATKNFGESQNTVKEILESFGKFFRGWYYLQSSADFKRGNEFFRLATKSFDKINLKPFKEISKILETYTRAISELHKSNLGMTTELFEKLRKDLEKQDIEFGNFRQIIDQFEPEQLFIQGTIHLRDYDFVNGEILINEAFQKSKSIANKYFKKDDPNFYTNLGVAHAYKTVYVLLETIHNLDLLEFTKIPKKETLLEHPLKAHEYLSKGNISNKIIQDLFRSTEGSIHLLKLIHDYSNLFNKILNENYKPQLDELELLIKEAQISKEIFSNSGKNYKEYVLYCDFLGRRISNLEKITGLASVPKTQLNPSAIERISKLMAERYTGTELTNFFSKIGMSEIIHDGTTKHKFLNQTLTTINQKDLNGTKKVIEQLCDPQEFFGEKEKHQDITNKINEVLSFYGLSVIEKTGKLTVSESLEGILQSQQLEIINEFDNRGYHPEITRHSRTKFIKGDFFGAVFEGCKAFEKKVSKKSEIEKHGSDLMSTTLSKNGILKLNKGKTESERNFQEGVMHLSMGIMKAVRNPEGHEPELDWQISMHEALDILSLLSYLNHQIDSAQKHV